jgi:signal transduction histidine kinase
MSLPRATDQLALSTSHQLTLTTLGLSGAILVIIVGFVFWSWWRRQQLARERRSTEAERRLLALESSRDELRRLAAHREALIEQERQRLAREFHDELGQVLTAARMQLQLLARDPSAGNIANIEALIGEAYRSVKAIAADLRPPALNMGLTAAVEWLADRLLKPAGICARIDFASVADQLPETQAIVVFRIVQETSNNCVRHSNAKQVWFSFHADSRTAQLVVRDDGQGFVPDAVDRKTHFGLLGLHERATALGGTLHIASRPGEGTTLTINFPLCSDS